MARRAGSRPLYELMVRRGVVARTPPEEMAPAPVDTPVAESTGLLTGRSVRVPMGYVMLSIAGLLIAVVAAYVYGTHQGRQSMRREYEPYLTSGGLVDPAQVARDPLGPGGGERAAGDPGRVPAAGAPAGLVADRTSDRRVAEGGIGEPGAAPPDGRRPIDSDPRQEGLYYLVLAETRPEGALRLATFCREHELDAYVIRRNNSRFCRVIVLPGLPTRSDTAPEYRRLFEKVLRVGRAWKALYPGDRDLSDAYLIP